jgi:hypothetical protein
MNLFRQAPAPATPIRTIPAGNEGFLIDLPAGLRTGREQDNTLTAFRPGKDFVVLRFSVLVLSLKLKPDALDLGQQHLQRLARSVQAELIEEDGRFFVSYEEDGREQPAARMHYCFTAVRNAVLVASTWVLKIKTQEPVVQSLVSACRAAARSFRPNPLFQAEEGFKPVQAALSSWETAFLEERRRMADHLVHSRLGLPGLPAGRGGLPVLQRLLDRKFARKGDIAALEALGVAFGDILASETGLEWAVESEPRGDIPVLRLPGSRVAVYATTLVWRRVERNEKVELDRLLDHLAKSVTAARA